MDSSRATRLRSDPRRRLRIVCWVTAAAAIGANALDLGGVTPGALWQPVVIELGFVTFALLGVYALFVSGESDVRARLAVLLVGLVLGAVAWAVSDAALEGLLRSSARGLGVASLGALVWRWARDRDDAGASWRLAAALLLPVFIWTSQAYLRLTVVVSDRILDSAVYATDATYGVSPSFAMARLFYTLPVLTLLAGYAYAALPFFVALVFALRQRSRDGSESDLLVAFLGAGAAGFVFYLLIPVVGPRPAYPGLFPYDPPANADAAPIGGADALRNCVPSLHTAWALLVLWHARPLAAHWKIAVATFFALNELATLGYGFHYLYDLVIAVPFTLALQAFAMRGAPRGARLRAAAAGVLLLAGWVGLAFPARPLLSLHVAVPWGLTALTVAACWQLEAQLWEPPDASGAAVGPPS